MRSYLNWGAINLCIAAYLLGFISYYWNNWEWTDNTCIADLSWWVIIYLLIHLLHIARKVAIIIIWKKAQDPTIATVKVDLVAIPCLVIPEVIWYIYGNTIIY